ncbi:MAG: hypothetical protein SP4CHLAM5_03610 [Chlamydiia bacterium]|nr:hypothetical protein [Chlamydiia bacterium]MCH9618235.1 hypothetical protein [Chlamydiia bacterium]MCH9624466.1 hypothetical protein [Chlamydiia bacterium]
MLKAALLGYDKAKFEVGMMCVLGQGTRDGKPDYEMALSVLHKIKWLSSLVGPQEENPNYMIAMYFLDDVFRKTCIENAGEYVLEFLKISAQQGHAEANDKLAKLYENGSLGFITVRVDKKKAKLYYKAMLAAGETQEVQYIKRQEYLSAGGYKTSTEKRSTSPLLVQLLNLVGSNQGENRSTSPLLERLIAQNN